MTPEQAIKEAYAALEDFAGIDPRSNLMLTLSAMQQDQAALPQGGLTLTASIKPGGECSVYDQHGRQVTGVIGVANFKDQSGRHVMQITL